MRILVTGGSGFLGSHLCEYLLDNGHQVICMDNFITGKKRDISHLTSKKGFTLIEYDITNPIKIDGKLDAVMHLASPASPIDYQKIPIETLKAGSFGTHNTLELAREKNSRYLLASTSEVYGDPLVNPQPESYWGNVNCVGPRGCYDEGKRYGEAIVMAYYRVHNVDTKIIRIFNTYGPRMRADDGRVVPSFVCQALRNEDITVFGDGKQTRSFCYVSDLIEGMFKVLMSSEHEPINLGNPEERTVVEYAQIVKKLSGSKSKIVFKELPIDDPKVRRPDITRAKKVLGWQPKISIEEGTLRTIEHFKNEILL